MRVEGIFVLKIYDDHDPEALWEFSGGYDSVLVSGVEVGDFPPEIKVGDELTFVTNYNEVTITVAHVIRAEDARFEGAPRPVTIAIGPGHYDGTWAGFQQRWDGLEHQLVVATSPVESTLGTLSLHDYAQARRDWAKKEWGEWVQQPFPGAEVARLYGELWRRAVEGTRRNPTTYVVFVERVRRILENASVRDAELLTEELRKLGEELGIA